MLEQYRTNTILPFEWGHNKHIGNLCQPNVTQMTHKCNISITCMGVLHYCYMNVTLVCYMLHYVI